MSVDTRLTRRQMLAASLLATLAMRLPVTPLAATAVNETCSPEVFDFANMFTEILHRDFDKWLDETPLLVRGNGTP